MAPKAIAEEITAAPELEQRFPVQNIHEPVDNEELLKEIDACGVSPLASTLPSSFSILLPSIQHPLTHFTLTFLQVGFIASLKNDHKHEIVTQVRDCIICKLFAAKLVGWPSRLPSSIFKFQPSSCTYTDLSYPSKLPTSDIISNFCHYPSLI